MLGNLTRKELRDYYAAEAMMPLSQAIQTAKAIELSTLHAVPST